MDDLEWTNNLHKKKKSITTFLNPIWVFFESRNLPKAVKEDKDGKSGDM